MNLLMKWLTVLLARNPKSCKCCCRQVIGRVHQRGAKQALQIVGSSDSPLRPHRSVPNFRDYLCADHEATARNVGSVSLFECGAMPQYCGKNSLVDADRRRARRHSSRAATNRFHSSSVRSSITNASGPA